MPLKVCHITTVHQAGDDRIFIRECCSLHKAGYDTNIIAPGDDRYLEGIRVIGIGKSKNRLDRFLSLSKKAYQKAKDINAEIYHIHDIELLYIGAALKKKGVKVIYDAHEDTPMQILDKGWIPPILRKFISKIIHIYELHYSKKMDLVITVTPLIEQKFKRHEIKTGLISNFPVLNNKKVTPYEERKHNICFTGGISPQWMHENILAALENIDNVEYVLAGSASPDYINKLKSKTAWEKVNYLGFVSHQRVWEIMQASGVGMALNDYVANVGYHEGSLGNTKLFEYMYAGLPVIATDFRIWKEIVEKNNCGFCVSPQNINQISNAISALLLNPTLAKTMGENGRKVIEKYYNWTIEEKKLLKFYDDLANCKRG